MTDTMLLMLAVFGLANAVLGAFMWHEIFNPPPPPPMPLYEEMK